MSTISEMSADYFAAREAYDEAHAESSARHKAMKDVERLLIDKMIEEGQTRVEFEEGLQVSLRNQFSVSCTDANNQTWRDWLVETQGDDTPYIKEVVQKKFVTELLRKHIEAGELSEDDVPEAFSLNTFPALYVRGWNSK